jgi:hypothetical protein
MLIHGDSGLAIKIFPAGIVLQLLSKLLLHLQEVTHHLRLGDHELLLDGHVGRRWRRGTPTCTKTIGGCTGWSHHLKFMRFSLPHIHKLVYITHKKNMQYKNVITSIW